MARLIKLDEDRAVCYVPEGFRGYRTINLVKATLGRQPAIYAYTGKEWESELLFEVPGENFQDALKEIIGNGS